MATTKRDAAGITWSELQSEDPKRRVALEAALGELLKCSDGSVVVFASAEFEHHYVQVSEHGGRLTVEVGSGSWGRPESLPLSTEKWLTERGFSLPSGRNRTFLSRGIDANVATLAELVEQLIDTSHGPGVSLQVRIGLELDSPEPHRPQDPLASGPRPLQP